MVNVLVVEGRVNPQMPFIFHSRALHAVHVLDMFITSTAPILAKNLQLSMYAIGKTLTTVSACRSGEGPIMFRGVT